MKEIILIAFIYFVVQMLRRTAQGQQPRQDLPEYRQPGEDAPLPGPWDIPGETRADTPLPGPWDNKSPRERPVEVKTEPSWEPEPIFEPVPVGDNRSHDRAVEQVRNPEPRRCTDVGTPVSRRDDFPVSAGETVTMQQRRRRRRKRRVNPLTAVLGSQSTLVGSMVLGQVLGTRGGLAGERKKTSSKNF